MRWATANARWNAPEGMRRAYVNASTSRVSFKRHERYVRDALRATCGPLRVEQLSAKFASRASSSVASEDETNDARAGVGDVANRARAHTTTEVWSSSRLRRVRATYVDGGEGVQIFNCVAYPSPRAHDAPLFGVDLISLGSGRKRKVLIGVDLQPTCRDASYAAAYEPALMKLRDGRLKSHALALGATTPSTKFYEDARFFSKGMFFARPTGASEDIMALSLDVVRAYFDAWISRLDEAEREAEAMDGACKFGLSLEDVRRCVLTETTARAGQDAHDAWQLEHDPAIGMFTSWYGEEWSREFAETVLFPGPRA